MSWFRRTLPSTNLVPVFVKTGFAVDTARRSHTARMARW